jgi:hypothetical protein
MEEAGQRCENHSKVLQSLRPVSWSMFP